MSHSQPPGEISVSSSLKKPDMIKQKTLTEFRRSSKLMPTKINWSHNVLKALNNECLKLQFLGSPSLKNGHDPGKV